MAAGASFKTSKSSLLQREVSVCVFVCLFPRQPWSHATQGMESGGCVQWMGPDPSRPTPKSRAVAKGFFAAPSATSGRPTATFREGAKLRENCSRQHPSSTRSQSTSGGSSSGRCCGSAEVTVCHCSVGQGAASGGQGWSHASCSSHVPSVASHVPKR